MRYHWQQEASLIKDIEFYAPHKEEEALIYAPPGAEPEKLWQIADVVKKLGFVAEPDIQGEDYVLRVKKFHSHGDLLNALQYEGFTQGSYAVHKSDLDHEKNHKLKPQQITGLLYMLGDTCMMGTGMLRNGWLKDKSLWEAMSGPGKKDISSGAKWLFAGALLYFLGAKDPDKQASYAYHDLLQSMQKAGFDISPEEKTTLKALAEHKDGILPKLERLVRENPLVINSILQASGGADAAVAGINQKRPGTDQKNWLKSASGVSTFVGHTTALLTDEKKKEEGADQNAQEPANADRSLWEKFNDWRREKKYRIAGSASVFTSFLRIVGGFKEVEVNKTYLDPSSDKGFAAEAERIRASLDAAIKKGDLPKEAMEIVEDYARPPTNRTQERFHGLVDRYSKLHDDHQRIKNAEYAARIELGVNCVKAVANGFYALAGSSVNADIKQLGILGELCNSVAHIAAKEKDPVLREGLVNAATTMLAEQKGIDNSPTEILQIVKEKLHAIESNPWERGNRGVGAVVTPAPEMGEVGTLAHPRAAANEAAVVPSNAPGVGSIAHIQHQGMAVNEAHARAVV